MEEDSLGILLVSASIVLLLFLHAFFSLAVAALTRARNRILESEEYEGVLGVRSARRVLDAAEEYLFVMNAGLYASVFFAGALLVGVSFIHGQGIQSTSETVVALDPVAALELFGRGLLLCAVVAFFAQLFAQLCKALGHAHPEAILCRIAVVLRFLGVFMRPLVSLQRYISSVIVRAFGLEPVQERDFTVSSEDLEELVEQSSEAGLIEEDEGEMLQGVVRFSDTLAREVMTPRSDIVAVEVTASLKDARDLFLSSGLSRVLVIEEDLDHVRGLLLAKDLIPLLGQQLEEFEIGGFVRDALSVSGTTHIDDVLEQFKLKKTHFAVVNDEHGGVDGVLTMEDLIEEIVGDIFDEHDIPDEFAEFEYNGAGDLLVDGSALIDDLNEEQSDYDFPQGEYDTIAGFLIHHLGRIPSAGELVHYEGLDIMVEEVEKHRVNRVRILRRSEPNDELLAS